jgi:hypothetical protein
VEIIPEKKGPEPVKVDENEEMPDINDPEVQAATMKI